MLYETLISHYDITLISLQEIIVQSIAFVVYGLVFCMFVAWQIAGTAARDSEGNTWFPNSQKNVQDPTVPGEILAYCRKCYNRTYVKQFEECPDFW